MSLYRDREKLKAQLIDSERMLEMVLEHPLMSLGLKEKILSLKTKIEALPNKSFEPKIQLLFSGKGVFGSQGIKSSFVSKTVNPIQEMVKTQAALVRFGRVGKRGKAKKAANSDLYLTALPVGSFGVELSQLETSDLFDSIDVSNAIKQVIGLISSCATDDATFEKAITTVPRRNLNNLKRFLEEIVEHESVLKVESNELGLNLDESTVKEAYERVSSTTDVESETIILGVFRGILLDSGKFEMYDEQRKKISGFISESLDEDQLVNFDRNFLNEECQIHLKVHKTTFKTGNEKIEYELLDITSLENS